MDMTAQLVYRVARQAAQPAVMAILSEILGTGLARAAPPVAAEKAAIETQRVINQGAVELLESWMAEDAAMAPAEQEAAIAEWEQLQQLLDEEYLADSHLLP